MAFKKESLTSLKEVDSTVEWDAMYDDDGLDEQGKLLLSYCTI